MFSNDETLKKLENSSKLEAKSIILDLIIPECRGVAKNFFDCVDQKTQITDFTTTNNKDIENELDKKYIPDCMKTNNLEGCLESIQNKNT